MDKTSSSQDQAGITRYTHVTRDLGTVTLLAIVLLILNACTLVPAASNEVVIKTSQPIATFVTSEAQRTYARERGLPVLLNGRAAQYPPDLDASKHGNGWVLLTIEVLASGHVGQVVATDQSDSAFHAAAIEAVRHWRFETAPESASFEQRITIIGKSADHLQRDSVVTQ